jgi:hypothetical protein
LAPDKSGGCGLGGLLQRAATQRGTFTAPPVLLNDVRQFMRQRGLSVLAVFNGLPVSKDDMIPDGVGSRMDGSRRFRRLRVPVHAHPAEIEAEPRLKMRQRRRIELLAR